MSTVAEIEAAMERLPTEQLLEVATWIEDRCAVLSTSESMFLRLDEAEGDDAGKHWLGE